MSENDQNTSAPANLDPEKLITLKQAAEMSGIGHSQLKKIAVSGRLLAKKMGRDWFTTPAAIEEYKASRKQGQRTDLGKKDAG